MARCYL